MELQQLRTFVAIADAGGVTAAAGRLHLSQPAVSRQIQALEASIGVRLIERDGRRSVLTHAGADLLQRCRSILAEAESLKERGRALQSGETGLLRIGATPPMIEAVLSLFLAGYGHKCPGVEVHITEDGGTALAERLDRGELHLAYVPAGDSRFAGRLLYPIHVAAAMPTGSGREVGPQSSRGLEITSLIGRPLLVLRRGFGSRELFETACRAAGMSPSVLLESGSPGAVLALARAGYGVGILPSGMPAVGAGLTLRPLVHRRQPIGHWTMLAWSARRFLPPYARRFADELARFASQSYPGRSLVGDAPAIARPVAPDVE